MIWDHAAPNGIFHQGLLLYGGLEAGAIASKGFWVQPPDVRGASFAQLNTLQDSIRGLLALATPGRRLQFLWSCDCDYRRELEAYRRATTRISDPVVHAARTERFTRYHARMTARDLRRERLAVFLSIEIERYSGNLRSRESLRRHYEAIAAELAGQFEDFGGTLHALFRGEAVVRPMTDAAHAALLEETLNPSLARHPSPGDPTDPEPGISVQDHAWHGDAVGQPDGGFVLDGHHFALLALDRWPRRTRPGIVTHLTGLPFLDYAIAVNVAPLPPRHEIAREEKAVERLSGEYADQGRHSLAVALRKKERKIENLAGGFVRPFEVTYLLRLWAPTREALREKLVAVQSAVRAMDGAQCFECALPTTAKQLFYATWPGWTHSPYRHRNLYAEDAYLADLLPFSATFTGSLSTAEALYDGSHGNLVGISTQTGGSPQHAVVLGMTGSGKSAAMHDLLLQTAGFFDYTVILEEGLSYKTFTERLGETPIIVHPDSALTINYLDTQGLPLSQLHLASATALLSRMIGTPDSDEERALRSAQLTQYLHQLYRDAYADWARRNPEAAQRTRRLACAVHRWRSRLPAGTSPLEAFADFRDRLAAGADEAMSLQAGLTEADITHFAQDPATERLVSQTACAAFTATDQPTHGALVELLAYARFPEHSKEEIDRLATLLRAWSADGAYGRLFDGPTSLSIQRRIAHFELGFVPEEAVEMKAAAGLLISGFARQHILALPRALRKRILFEEVARFLDVPGGEQLVAESYAQLRKFNCWAVSIIQQYARFRTSRVRPAVIGNAKQFLIMRQSDRSDLTDLAADIGLPEGAVDAIQRYPLPEQLPDGKRYSSLCYYTPTTQPPQCGTVRNIQPHAT
jgi:type IV secretion system protein TrbE